MPRSIFARQKSIGGDWKRFTLSGSQIIIDGFPPSTVLEIDIGDGIIREHTTLSASNLPVSVVTEPSIDKNSYYIDEIVTINRGEWAGTNVSVTISALLDGEDVTSEIYEDTISVSTPGALTITVTGANPYGPSISRNLTTNVTYIPLELVDGEQTLVAGYSGTIDLMQYVQSAPYSVSQISSVGSLPTGMVLAGSSLNYSSVGTDAQGSITFAFTDEKGQVEQMVLSIIVINEMSINMNSDGFDIYNVEPVAFVGIEMTEDGFIVDEGIENVQ